MLSKMLSSFAVFSIISIILLYIGFSLNLYKAADYELYEELAYSRSNWVMKESEVFSQFPSEDIFLTFDRWSESLVLGRLVKSRKDGLFSTGGFVGRYRFGGDTLEPLTGDSKERFLHAYQYRLYLDRSLDAEVNEFDTYKSQFGGQAILLSVLDRIMIGKNSFKLKFYYHLMAAMSAISIFIIILWFAKEFGLLTGWLLTISFSLFCYPTLFGKSLWWILWAFYVPFLIFLYMLRKEELSLKNFTHVSFIVIGFCSMVIKIFFNGFEYITTTFLMPLVPLFYYSIKNKWDARLLIIRSVCSICGISLALVICFLLLSLQFVLAGEKFEDGLNHIQTKFQNRTKINKTSGREIALVHDSNSKLSGILKYYVLHPVVVDLHSLGIKRASRKATMIDFLIIFQSISFVLIFVIKILRKKMISSSTKALIITHWLAFIPPLSWFIVFKQHSFIHKLQDPIVWYMPYMFFGVALCGIFLKEIVLPSSESVKN